MTFFMRVCLALFLLVSVQTPAFADRVGDESSQVAIPRATVEGLVARWEESLRHSASSVAFAKTDEENVYNFETTFFPYKGRLKLLNAAVVADTDSYYDDVYEGIIEVDLLDADDDFRKKYSRSYYAWQEMNRFYFDAQNNLWFPAANWTKYLSQRDAAAAAESKSSGCPLWKNAGLWRSVLPLGFFLLVILGLIFFARKQNKRIWDNHAKALEEQQRGLKMVEESLNHQREHTKLLQDILQTLKK